MKLFFFFFSQHWFNVGLAERNCMEKLTIVTWLVLWDWSDFSTWRVLSIQNVMHNLKTSYACLVLKDWAQGAPPFKIKLKLEVWESPQLCSERTLSEVCQERNFKWPREHWESLVLFQSKDILETPLPWFGGWNLLAIDTKMSTK